MALRRRTDIIATSQMLRRPSPFDFKEQPRLFAVELVARPAAQLPNAFDSPHASSKFRTQQTRVRRFVG